MRHSIFLVLLLASSCSDFFKETEKVPAPGLKTMDQPREVTGNEEPKEAELCKNSSLPPSVENVAQSLVNCLGSADLKEFQQEAQLLLKRFDNGASLDSLKDQWKNTMVAFQRFSLARVEPFNVQRDWVYSFPVFNPCMVDENVVHVKKFEELKYPDALQAQGLQAMEYLLFDQRLRGKCTRRVQEVWQWNKLEKSIKLKDRISAAHKIAEKLERRVSSLVSDWGSTHSKKVTGQTLLNEISDSLVIELEKLKNLKTGIPLGLHNDCPEGEFCPEEREHLYSDLSFLAIKEQLTGFERYFFGSKENSLGFDDLLDSANHKDISVAVKKELKAAQATLEKLSRGKTFVDTINVTDYDACQLSSYQNQEPSVCGFHHQLKKIINIMKSRVLIALSLIAPPSYQGDGDGGKL